VFDMLVYLSNTVVNEPREVVVWVGSSALQFKAAVTKWFRNASKSGLKAWRAHDDTT
jgi:hypothetical protein